MDVRHSLDRFGMSVSRRRWRGRTCIVLVAAGWAVLQAASAGAATLAYVASELADTVSVVDVASADRVAVVAVGRAPVALAPTCDGSRIIVSNAASGTLSVIDVASSSVVDTWRIGQPTGDLLIHPDCDRVVVGVLAPGGIVVVDLESGTVRKRIALDVAPRGMAWRAGTSRLHVAGYLHDRVAVVDVDSGAVDASIDLFPGSGPYEVVVARDGQHAFFADVTSNVLSMVDAERGEVLRTIPTGNAPVSIIELPPPREPRLLVLAGDDDALHVVHPQTLRVEGAVAVGAWPAAAELDPSQRTIAVANFGGSDVSLLDVETLELRARVAVDPGPRAVTFVDRPEPPASRFDPPRPQAEPADALIIRSQSRRLYVLDLGTGAVRRIEFPQFFADALVARSDGGKIWIGAGASVVAIDVKTSSVLGEVDTGNVRLLALSPDERKLFVVKGSPQQLVTVDASKLVVEARLNLDFAAQQIAVGPSGARVYLSHGDSAAAEVIVVDTDSNRELGRIALPAGAQVGLAPDADGRMLFAASDAGRVFRIDANEYEIIDSREFRDGLQSLHLGRDGALGVTTHGEGYRAFNAATGLFSRAVLPPEPCDGRSFYRRAASEGGRWAYLGTGTGVCVVDVLGNRTAAYLPFRYASRFESIVDMVPIHVEECRGDCSADGSVTVDEIVLAVNVGLGIATLDVCRAADVDGDGSVTVDEVIRAIRNALEGCG